MKRFFFALLILFAGFGTIRTASAHGLEAGQMSLLLDDVKATVTLAPSVGSFLFADEDGDGLISLEELKTHQAQLEALIKEQVVLRNESGEAAIPIYVDVVLPDGPSLNGLEGATGNVDQTAADFLHVTLRMVWPKVPEIVDVEYRLLGSADERISYLMKDSTTDAVLEGEFSAAETVIRLRGEGSPIESRGGAIWLIGIQHVLTGYDHILFVLALVLVATQLRTLLLLITTFTLAHTVTLAAVAFGYEPPIPGWMIEAIIAASIGILAAIYLFGITVDVWWVTALLGLVHGLGFGQAMTASLGSLQAWGSTLFSITLGVELTHLVIALIGFGALHLIKNPAYLLTVRRVTTFAILCIGLYWTIERILI